MRGLYSLVLGCMIFAGGTFANNPIILVKEILPGYILLPPGQSTYSNKIIIYRDGQVVDNYILEYADGHTWENVTPIAFLPQHIINSLLNSVADFTEGTLIFPDEEHCVDAGIQTYSLVNKFGDLVHFAKEVNCLLGKLNDSYAIDRLKQILDGFHLISTPY